MPAPSIPPANAKNQPLIKINCAALPSNLIESELFVHEKGAFTGAVNKRIGRFELAEGGGQTSIKMNVRVITATNRNLLREVAEKNFREDLFYRLNVFPVTTPPLRERLEDIRCWWSF